MHKLLTDSPSRKLLLLGNEAIARGGVEAGVALASTYPGTPSSEISLNFFHISRESDLYFEYSTNEKVALEVAAAAANAGLRSMCVMKHVGVNVAADALMTLAYVGVKAGLVIISADDPAMFSSQNEQDNRYYGLMSGLPVVEPTSVAEAREMVPFAFDLSEELGLPVIFRTTTRINHSTAPVILGDIRPRVTRGHFNRDPFNYVTVPAVSRKLHARLLETIGRAAAISEICQYNTVDGDGTWGIVTNGVSYAYVSDAILDLGIADRTRLLRIGMSHPMPAEKIRAFLSGCDRVLVVEEGEPYMETAIRSIAQGAGLTLPIRGKDSDLFSRLYEFSPAVVRRTIAAYFGIDHTPPPSLDLSDLPEIPQRPPNLCAGCSHRATYYAVKTAAEGLDVIHPTDIGCYTLGFLPPLSMGDFLLCMGSSVGTSCGFSAATDQRPVAFIGDSTFFHSGIPGLVNAVFNGHRLTLVILDNGTTAMTGHQPHPGVDMEALSFEGFGRVSIEAVVRAIGVGHVTTIRPYNVKKSVAAVRESLEYPGVSVVIAQEPCVLFARSLGKKRGRPFTVTDRCKNHRTCIESLACPAFFIEDDRVRIDEAACTGCSVCAQICPEGAISPARKSAED